MKESYLKLKNTPLELCERPIRMVRRGNLASEYNDFIFDYSKSKKSLSSTLLKPYITSETHGKDVFNDLICLVGDLRAKTVLDLGCGAGEFLSLLKSRVSDIKPYGITIHLGEVKFAREQYGLEDVMPVDMREIDEFFEKDSLDCVVAHACLHFITQEERVEVSKKVQSILKPNGYFIIVDYKFDRETGLPYFDESLFKNVGEGLKCKTMGNLTLLQKCVTNIATI